MNFVVVIPSRNSDNLEACVAAIRDAGETCRILVVDNGLVRRPEGCEYIDYFEPFIFAKAINLGIKAAGDSDIIATNDDTLLKTPGGFRALQKCAEENPEYGIIAASCNNVGNTNQHQQKGGRLREEPRMVCFVAVLIPARTIDLVGLLDERYGSGGYEDDDFCLRVRQAGLKVGIFDGTFVDHASLTSTFRGPGGPGYNPDGMKIFIEKWGFDNRECGYAQSPYKHLFPQHAAVKASDEERIG